MKAFVFAGLALVLGLGACGNTARPLTDNDAARLAAECLQWPEEAVTLASNLSPPGPAPGDGMIMAFQRAGNVVIRPDGRCDLEIVSLRSGNLIRNLPAHAFFETRGPRGRIHGTYMLLLLETYEDGSRHFIGVRGDGADVEIPPSGQPA